VAPIGDHRLVASWKGPDGRVLSISPDGRPLEQYEFYTMSTPMEKKVFTRPLEPGPSFLWDGTSDKLSKNPSSPPPDMKTEFRKGQEITVQMNWLKRDTVGKGTLSAEIFHAANHLLGNVQGKTERLLTQ
jgi:hypothetical protein